MPGGKKLFVDLDTALDACYTVSMKVGDTVRLVQSPRVDWMTKYLDKTFEVVDFPTKSGVQIKMTGTDPGWFWIVGKDNFVVVGDTPEPAVTAWFLYVVKCNDDTLYTGITTDTTRRLHEHNNTAKGAKYTKKRRPVTLLYTVNYTNRSGASQAESKFKKLSRKQKLRTINENR